VPESGSPGPSLENRLPAEGISSSTEHPLREFAWLLGASLAGLAALVVVVGWLASWLAPRVPFAAEVALAERVVDPAAPRGHADRTAALQAIADRVASRMDLPAGMTVVLAYEDSPVINAYATLGGRIRVYSGLLDQLQSEDELAALLAHEIAHVRHRHVAASLGRGLAVALVLGVVSADAGAAAAQSTLGQAASLAMLSYSREQEAQADADALRAVVALYGHAGGVTALFHRLRDAAGDGGPEWTVLRSHPLTDARLAAIEAETTRQAWPASGPLTALPEALQVGKAEGFSAE
jgi:predicted Zn-dependent protease